MEVERTKPKGHLRKPWWDGVKEDMKRFGLSREDEQSKRNVGSRFKPLLQTQLFHKLCTFIFLHKWTH